MQISFCKDKKEEIFNGKKYPIGTTFINIMNQMSNLTNNHNFVLETYKNTDFCEIQLEVMKELMSEKVLHCLGISKHENQNLSSVEIQIENEILTYSDFKDLILFIRYLDLFITVESINHFNKINEKAKLYFSLNYEIPNPTIIDNELSNKYNHHNINFYKNNSFDNLNEFYTSVCISEEQFIKEIGKSSNIVHQYECKNFIQVLLASYLYILDNQIHLKKCKNCGRFFIAKNANRQYCDNIRPQTINETKKEYLSKKMTCKEFNKKILTAKPKTEVDNAIRSVTLRIQKRIRNKIETKEYLKEWKYLIKTNRKYYQNDIDYINWLKYESDIHQIRRCKTNGSKGTSKK